MKKLIFIMITVAVGLTAACNKENDTDDTDNTDDKVAEITMTTAKEGLVRFYLSGTGTVIINWGDGTPNETTTFMDGVTQYYSHTYTISTIRTITIFGDNVTYLCCGHNPGDSGDIFNNQLTGLNVSKNASLRYLECYNNQLTTLDISKNTTLGILLCNNNQLTALDVSKNTAVAVLVCDNNRLTALDVSKNTALTALVCNNNQLTDLDVSKNTALTVLNCGNNLLTVLDVSKNTVLTQLVCDKNQLTALDLSKNTMLFFLGIDYNLFDAKRLDALFLTLHSNTVIHEGFINKKTIYILNNPGTATCNPNIAEEKGWDVLN